MATVEAVDVTFSWSVKGGGAIGKIKNEEVSQ
jgi:hypothetical protein